MLARWDWLHSEGLPRLAQQGQRSGATEVASRLARAHLHCEGLSAHEEGVLFGDLHLVRGRHDGPDGPVQGARNPPAVLPKDLQRGSADLTSQRRTQAHDQRAIFPLHRRLIDS